MGEICILHAPETGEFARHAAAALAGEGHSVFRRETGAPVGDHPKADAVIVVWSPTILSDPEMLDAARRALARRTLVPVALGEIEPPGSFAHVWPIDLAGWQGDRNDPRWQFVRDEIDLAVRRNEGSAESAPVAERQAWAVPKGSMRMFVPAAVAVAVAVLAGIAVLLVPPPIAVQPDEALTAALEGRETRPVERMPSEPAKREPVEEAKVAAADARPVAAAAPIESRPEPAGVDEEPVAAETHEERLAAQMREDEALSEGDIDPEQLASPEQPLPATEALPLPPPAADNFAGVVFRDCADCPDMAEIPAAPVEAASLDTGLVYVSTVTSAPFALSRREVTFAEWSACVAERACRPVSDAGWGRDKRPVINVSFDDAQSYVMWLSLKTGRQYRLPTKAEWELAAGKSEASPRAANLDGGPGARRDMTTPAGSFAPSVHGLYDMLGNVWEWVADCSAVGESADCSRHIIKGGAWNTPAAAEATGTKPAVEAGADVGFRVARDLS